MPRLLIVDDEPGIRRTLKDLMTMQGYEVEDAENGAVALEKLESGHFDLVLSDIQMPKTDGMELLKASKASNPDLPFIMLTAYASIERAVEAIKIGAYDFVPKPPNLQHLLVTVGNALATKKLKKEHTRMKARLEKNRWRYRATSGRESSDGADKQVVGEGRAEPGSHPGNGRSGIRKGAHCPMGSPAVKPKGWAVRRCALRCNPVRVDRERAVWP